MARKRTFTGNTIMVSFEPATEMVTMERIDDGFMAQEKMNKSLRKRLEELGVPEALWRGSKRTETPKPFCSVCDDVGEAYGGICVCIN